MECCVMNEFAASKQMRFYEIYVTQYDKLCKRNLRFENTKL